jgi:hypothetical protein
MKEPQLVSRRALLIMGAGAAVGAIPDRRTREQSSKKQSSPPEARAAEAEVAVPTPSSGWKRTEIPVVTGGVLAKLDGTVVPKDSTATPEAGSQGITFVFGEGVTQQQQNEIRSGTTLARDWLSSKVGIKIDDVYVFASGSSVEVVDQYLARTIFPQQREEVQKRLANATAFTGEKKDLFIITSSPGWLSASPIIGGPVAEGRTHTLIHEYFHVFQRDVGGYNGSFPHWLNEGGAHYVAARGLADNGVYSYVKIREGHLTEAVKVRESLRSMESAQGFYGAGTPYADEYSLGFLATEYLVKDLPNNGIAALTGFWQEVGRGNPWQTSFQSSFGKTLDQFYAEFESVRPRL